MDFSPAERPVLVSLESGSREVLLSVENEGPPLPEQMSGQLFESLVSVRGGGDGEPHLGLGLYIVRLIAQFHGGDVEAANRPKEDGVVLRVRLPMP